MIDSSKRRLLFLSPLNQTISPLPWLKSPDDFQQDCTQCGDCVSACKTQIIIKGPGGYPTVNFDIGECSFCYACADACEEPIFLPKTAKPWQQVAIISEDCLAQKNVVCRSCSEACETLAIQFQLQIGKAALPMIDLEACTGCGGCVSVCPATAINISTPTPEGL